MPQDSDRQDELDRQEDWGWSAGDDFFDVPEDEVSEDEEDDVFEGLLHAPMDEFEWERFLEESDKLTDRFAEILKKYADRPDRDRLVAGETGSSSSEDVCAGPSTDRADSIDAEDNSLFPLEPNPLTEGTDWVKTRRGRVTHPLTERSFQLAQSGWREFTALGLLEDDGDADLREMVLQAQTLTAKLAGALDGLAFDDEPEGGFVVACLKRALRFLNGSLAASQRAAGNGQADGAVLARFRDELLEIREEMLRIMSHYRDQIS
ncbi:hypothetical protein ACFLSJ_01365 [Verrucomicrobiota bacterium]